jgi:hypothetical protein
VNKYITKFVVQIQYDISELLTAWKGQRMVCVKILTGYLLYGSEEKNACGPRFELFENGIRIPVTEKNTITRAVFINHLCLA